MKCQAWLISSNTKMTAAKLRDHKIPNSVCSMTQIISAQILSASNYWKFQTFTSSYLNGSL